ncbi:cysteine hydrolase family protein [Canibacter oris]|uniref:Nicotinamidase-related amidase n=1 Tax=Canibacter oris TaxID=1365628 RepID=A0A840DK01_9MICO|nr:isochorismatase family protein [Canibacter oris]MBB4071812.1 nicotinamidase-related amidase [Canibacter oris]
MNPHNRWLVIVDPQNIFAATDSPWGSPFFADAWGRIAELAPLFPGRIVITRWLPTAPRNTSWGTYFQTWEFADRPATDPLFDLTPEAAALAAATGAQLLDTPKFGKWGETLKRLVTANLAAGTPELVVTGVATDCCVISTVLPALDDGCYVTVVRDAVAGSTAANNAAALQVLELYEPMARLVSSAELRAELDAARRDGQNAEPGGEPKAELAGENEGMQG